MKFYHSTLLNSVANVTHAFTTKDTGNLAFHVNDDPLGVEKNHEQLASELHWNKQALIHMQQIHSADVHIVTDTDNFSNPHTCDALVTNKKKTPLMVMVADCSPILFYDIKNEVIAVAHAGRQGAFKNIIQNTLDSMNKVFSCEPENTYVSVGASIGVCCYEVGNEIYEEAIALNLSYSIEKKENSYYLDIAKILKKQLLKAGILEQNIEISQECTSCNTQKYYSYRAEQQTGRFAGVISLR